MLKHILTQLEIKNVLYSYHLCSTYTLVQYTGLSLSGGHRVVVEHWQLKLQDAGSLGLIYVDLRLLTSLPFHLVTSKHLFNCKLQMFSFYVASYM